MDQQAKSPNPSSHRMRLAGRIAHGFIDSKLTPLVIVAALLLGAFSIVWPMLPPMSFIYRAAERRRARAQLDAAMAQPPAPPVDVNITTESPYRL